MQREELFRRQRVVGVKFSNPSPYSTPVQINSDDRSNRHTTRELIGDLIIEGAIRTRPVAKYSCDVRVIGHSHANSRREIVKT